MQNFRQFLKEITTVKTVWIDKGQGKWVEKKRMHPFMRGFIGVSVIILALSVYLNFPVFKKVFSSQKAEAESEVSRVSEVKEVKKVAGVKAPVRAPEPEKKRESLTISLSDSESDTSTRGMIISEPEKLFKPAVSNNNDNYRILVSKSNYTLSLFKGNELVKEYPIAVGKNPGDKKRVGDHRTPVGNFKIVSIEPSSNWKHDFGDGKGKIAGAYGPWFLRLDANGWKGIGIHGTHDPDSRGTMATEGCIRLSNEDIAELKEKYAYRNMPVTIREN